MGSSYTQNICIGYRVDAKDLYTPFIVSTTPATYQMEDRYDPVTGQKTAPEKVQLTQEVYRFELDGVDITNDVHDPEFLSKKLSDKIGCKYTYAGDFCSGETFYYFTVPVKSVGSAQDEGRAFFGSSLDYEDAVRMHPALQKLGEALRKLGLKAEGPCIWNATSVG